MKLTKLNSEYELKGITEIVGFKSPTTVAGQRILPVVFWSEVQRKSFIINIPWERAASICVGYRYNYGYLIEKGPFEVYGTVFVDEIECMEIVKANRLIISWRPGYKKIHPEIGDEYFVKFVHRGQVYAVSCVEIIRAIFTTSMVIANQLLTTDGFFQ